MEFFVPGMQDDPETAELEYAALAELAGRSVPPRGARVYSIQFVTGSDRWTATVGQPWRGERLAPEHGDGEPVERLPCCSAAVLAIFPGDAHVVVTEAFPLSATRCVWRNPLTTTDVTSVELFAEPTSSATRTTGT